MRSLPAHREQSTRAESPSQTLGVALRDEVEARRDPGIEAALEKMAEPQEAFPPGNLISYEIDFN